MTFGWDTTATADPHRNSGHATASPSTNATPTAPVTTTVEATLPDSAGWELVGLQVPEGMGTNGGSGPSNVVRYQPSTGHMVTTTVPPLESDNPFSLIATKDAVIVRPVDPVVGYIVPDGQLARELPGKLARSGGVLPGPDADHVWVPGTEDSVILTEFDVDGESSGTTIAMPPALSKRGTFGLTPDGAGYVLAEGTGGTYLLRPGGAQLVTHGDMLAAGRATFLLYECSDTADCESVVADRKTGNGHPLPDFTPSSMIPIQGVVSPDGRYAGLLQFGQQGTQYTLVDLRSGTSHSLPLSMPNNPLAGREASSLMAFTPDSDYLLVATSSGVVPIDTATGKDLDRLPIPPLSAIAIRSGS